MRTIQTFFCSAFCIAMFIGCNRGWSQGASVSGDGNVTTDTRQLASYSAIDFEGSYDVVLTQATESSVKIEADKNLLPFIKTEVKSGKLVVSTEGNLSPTKRMKIYLSTPQYSLVDVEGAADIQGATPIKAQDLKLTLSGSGSYNLEVHTKNLSTNIEGSGKITLTGDVTDHKITIDGSGDLAAIQMPSVTTSVDVSGSGDAQVFVMQRLDANISGSGNIQYKGAVSDVHTNVSGSGKVEKIQ